MTKELIVNPNNKVFRDLMERTAEAIRKDDAKALAKVKTKFAKYDAVIFYNEQLDSIRVSIKDRPHVDLPTSTFTNIEYKKK